MANIFFGKSKKQRLVAEVNAMGMGALVLVDNNGEFLLEKVWYQPWSFRLIQNHEDFFANFAKILPSFVSAFPVKQYSLTLCIGDSSNKICHLQTAVVEDEEELEEMLISKKLMPSQDKYMSEAHALGASISELKTSQDVLIHSVDRELAQTVMDAFEEKGYELVALEYPSNAHIAFQDYFCEQGRPESDLMLSLGWESSTVSIFYQGKIRFAASLQFRLLDFVQDLIKRMEMSEEDALRLLRKGFFEQVFSQQSSGVKLQIPEEIIKDARAELEFLLHHIQQCIASYVGVCCEWKTQGVERLVCCGLECSIEPLYNYVVSWLKLPAIRLLPVDSVSQSPEARAKLSDSVVSESLVNLFGLALRTFGAE